MQPSGGLASLKDETHGTWLVGIAVRCAREAFRGRSPAAPAEADAVSIAAGCGRA